MDSLERRKFELHAQSDEYSRRIDRAAEWIDAVFDRFGRPCVNFSGGKDSLVMLHLVTDHCGYDAVPVYYFDNGLLEVPGASSFVEDRVAEVGGRLFKRTSEAANSPAMLREEGHGYKGFWGWYRRLADEHGWDVRLIGIRAAESRERRDRFDTDSGPPVNHHEQFTSAAPIHELTTRDVWAYIVEHNLEYHPIYDEQADLYGGMESRGNRLVTLYDSEFDSLGARSISQFIYPERTNELKQIEYDDASGDEQ